VTKESSTIVAFGAPTTEPDAPKAIPRPRRPSPAPPMATVAESDPATRLVHRDSLVDLPAGSIVDDLYEIDARLGHGAMGEVYAAHHVKLGKRVAIKVIAARLSEDSAAIDRFANEARTLARIQHPAIVAVEHVGELADGRAYFVMEFLRGESLFERIQRGRVPLLEALRILDQMARGLEAAHAAGITHRDLKPENVFLVHLPDEPPLVKIVDFGLAKIRADVDHRAERTQSGVAIGTPMYMSPEQARGAGVDHRTDIYALGAVAYELVLGRPLFPHARTAPELYAAHLHEAPPPPRSIWPEIPPQLDLALFAMIAKDPAYRPTLAQIRSVLASARTAAASPSQRAATELVAPSRARQLPKSVVIAATTAVALLGGIAIGAALMTRSRGEAPVAAPIAPVVRSTTVAAPLPPPSETTPIETPPPPVVAPIAKRADVARSVRPRASVVESEAPVDAAPVVIEKQQPVAIPEKKLPPQRPRSIDKPIDKNQTINPFKRKVNP
jgi:eukaryotic-like serine/threonine-protein kinase